MTVSTIFAPVQTAPLVNPDGTGTSQLLLFLNQFLGRTGGVLGGTYSPLTVNGGVILWNLASYPIAVVQLNSGANTLAQPLNQVAGAPPYRLTVIQPSSGAPGTIVWPKPPLVFSGGVAPTLSTGNNAVDVFSFNSDGKNLYLVTEGLNFS